MVALPTSTTQESPSDPTAQSISLNEDSKLPVSFTTKIFSSTELLSQPWLPQLTEVINESFFLQLPNVRTDAIRLHSNTQLSEELGENGFTAVAFSDTHGGQFPGNEVEIIGTASVKDWVDEGIWSRYDSEEPENASESSPQIQEKFACDGDHEVAVVAIPPGPRYRKRGIAESLVKVCEQEILRRFHKETGDRKTARAMVKVNKGVNGLYWSKKGFTPIGSRWCPKGTWGQLQPFTMWAMAKDLSISEVN
ncbi:hypothetical protein AWENTII_010228 [Aspergillus wentii]|nr:hypothetical protein MW887_009425 [Aspergillus wentii]